MKNTNPLEPMSNWHRMLTMLNLNGGTLYRSQMYQSKLVWNGATRTSFQVNNHPEIQTGNMPKMTGVKACMPLSYAYEERAEKMGLVTIQRHKNRKWIILLPKGRTVLMVLDRGQTWIPDV